MRDPWKSGGGFPPFLFLLETGVSSLCPVPCSEAFYQEEPQLGAGTGSSQGNQQRASRRPGSRCLVCSVHPHPAPAPLPGTWTLGPLSGPGAQRSACLLKTALLLAVCTHCGL